MFSLTVEQPIISLPRSPTGCEKKAAKMGGESMKSRNYILSAAALVLTAAFATGAPAQAKEGTASFTFAGIGTFKATEIGKDRLILAEEEKGLDEGSSNPMFDHMTWLCYGIGDFTKGAGQTKGYCVQTDPAGDQFVKSFVSEKFSLGQKESIKGSETLTGGTGKFAGIAGSGTFVFDGNSFKPTDKGTFLSHGTHNLSYKLP
jgi:hypothetical protein